MSEKRSYCLADKPFPVGAKAMDKLRRLAEFPTVMWGVDWNEAPRQFERLRRSGYATRFLGEHGEPRALITEAGRALLERGG